MNLQDNHLAIILNLKRRLQRISNINTLLIIILVGVLWLKYASHNNKTENIHYNDYLAKIKIEGVIIEDSYRSEILNKILENDKIKGLIVEVDSPGGSIVGSEILYEELYKIAKKKPLAIAMNSLAASGGYMISLSSDYIVARNGTITGSIGVIMQSTDITDLADKIGIKFHNYKSAPLKGTPSPFEKTSVDADKVINESIADSYQFFTDLVRQRRGDKITNLSELFDGRVFTGRQALKLGLIDEIGGTDKILEHFSKKHLLPIKKLPIIEISLQEEEENFIDKILRKIPFSKDSQLKLLNNSGLLAIYR
jgi:protease-4